MDENVNDIDLGEKIKQEGWEKIFLNVKSFEFHEKREGEREGEKKFFISR